MTESHECCPTCGCTKQAIYCVKCGNKDGLNIVISYNKNTIELECPICMTQDMLHIADIAPDLMEDFKKIIDEDPESPDKDRQLILCRNRECDSTRFMVVHETFINRIEMHCVDCNTLLFRFDDEDDRVIGDIAGNS